MPDPLAYHVLLSHNYAYDLAALQALLGSPAPYIGLLGPRLKAQRNGRQAQPLLASAG